MYLCYHVSIILVTVKHVPFFSLCTGHCIRKHQEEW